MEKELKLFMEKINIINKDFAVYEDYDKGTIVPVNTISLLANLEYLELEKTQFDVAVFQQKIDGSLDYKITNIKKPVPKIEITGKDEDKNTIVEKECAVRQVWNVSNRYGAFQSFNDKDEAIAYAQEINKKIFEALGV